MGNGPIPFPDVGRQAKDLLTKDYNFDHKFTLLIPSSTGMGITATGLKRDGFFVGDLSTQYKRGNTTVDVKVDTYSNVSTKVTVDNILPSTKAAFSFSIPDDKSGKLDVQHLYRHMAISSSIGLNPVPLLEVSATAGTKDLTLGTEIGFDTASSYITKWNFGLNFNIADLSAALILADKGDTLKASYIHSLNSLHKTEVAAELTHRLSTHGNTFTIGSSHAFDPCTIIKTRLSNDGKIAMLCQREWRPKSLITFSAEYDSKDINEAPKVGLALALKP